ncbi:hypothetical protein ACIP8Z_20870 [Streptomyces sp. NPDC088553]|uniref:hypothetical protein n=1 Tax=Streptomyces sp. NPDC088553 TaxID=3365864 RepID=UPI0037F90EDC
MRMPKQDLAAFSTALSTALTSTAKLGAAAAQDTGPTPAARRPPRRELPRTGRGEARNRFQAPRRTY